MRKKALTHDKLRSLFLALPGVEEAPCYGTPGFRVRKKLLARFHQDGDSLLLVLDFETRDFLLRHKPSVFYITDHYRNYPTVLVRIALADPDEVMEHFVQAWRRAAPKKLIAVYDAQD